MWKIEVLLKRLDNTDNVYHRVLKKLLDIDNINVRTQCKGTFVDYI